MESWVSLVGCHITGTLLTRSGQCPPGVDREKTDILTTEPPCQEQLVCMCRCRQRLRQVSWRAQRSAPTLAVCMATVWLWHWQPPLPFLMFCSSLLLCPSRCRKPDTRKRTISICRRSRGKRPIPLVYVRSMCLLYIVLFIVCKDSMLPGCLMSLLSLFVCYLYLMLELLQLYDKKMLNLP